MREVQMIRRIAAVALALILNPAFLHAQETVFTVTVPTASVYKGPSNVTPVIGRVTSGTELNVSRNLGGWVKVAWPGGEDGIGYVRASMGRLGGAEESASATNVSPRPSPAATTSAPAARTSAGQQIPSRGQPRVREISHIFGIGAVLAPMNGIGATARAWHKNHLAMQVGFVRDAVTSDIADGRVTTIGFEPAVSYAPFDRVGDYVWIRPYVGSGVSFVRQSFSLSSPLAAPPISESGVGFRAFGGGELTFAGMPQFGLSADVGYRHLPAPFAGFKADPLTLSLAGHWYIK
jgi:uncharacterized protein YraI